PSLSALLKKGDKFATLDQVRSLIRQDRETVLDPVSHRIAVDLEGGGDLLDRVTTQRLDAAPVRAPVVLLHDRPSASISARISSTRQAVIRGPSFTGLGKRPDLTPSHQVDLPTGMTAGIGGSALGSPMIWGRRRKPVSGRWCILDCS